MYCSHCGAQTREGAAFCAACGQPLRTDAMVIPAAGAGAVYSGSRQLVDRRAAYAGFWARFAAVFLDGIIIGIVSIVLQLIVVGSIVTLNGTDSDGAQTAMASLLVTLVVMIIQWIYYAAMESSAKQATLGKLALGIIVTDEQGERISFARATGRHFASYLSSLLLGIGYLMMLWTDKAQTLHDKIASTLVLKKD